MLQLINVTKAYGTLLLFDQLNTEFKCKRTCLVGENGCGKTTLLLIMAGIESIQQGQVLFNQQSTYAWQSKQHIGLSSPRVEFPSFLTAKQCIEFYLQQFKQLWPTDLIAGFNFNEQLGTKTADLSLGNQKKLSLILAMAHAPALLMLDEPTTGLDEISRAFLIEQINARSGQLVMASHDHELIALPDTDVIELSLWRQC